MDKRQLARIEQINQVKRCITNCIAKGIKIIEKKFLLQIMSINHVSNRTAKEYTEQALFELKLEKEDLYLTKKEIKT